MKKRPTKKGRSKSLLIFKKVPLEPQIVIEKLSGSQKVYPYQNKALQILKMFHDLKKMSNFILKAWPQYSKSHLDLKTKLN